MSLMITSSQQASPALPDHQLKVAPDRTLMSAAPDVDLRMRASLTTDPFAESPQRLGMIIESPVSISRSNRVPGFETIPDVHSSAEKSLDKQLGEVIGVANIAARRLSHADTLPRDILQRVFFFYAADLQRDASSSPFAALETLLHICSHWKSVAQDYENIWSKVYITLTNMHDIEKWKARIRRWPIRASFPVHISIQDQRDRSLYWLLNAGTTLDQPKPRGGFLARLNDIVSLTTELYTIMSDCRHKSFRLVMPPFFPEMIHLLDGDAKVIASSYLNRIFPTELHFLESLELENVGWVKPAVGDSNYYPKLPHIFKGLGSSFKMLRLYNCFLPKVPDLDKPYELHLEHCFHWNPLRHKWEPVGQKIDLFDVVELKVWTYLQTFTIGPLTANLVPFCLPSLHTLEVIPLLGEFAYPGHLIASYVFYPFRPSMLAIYPKAAPVCY
ncbi:SubName: Full=Uncharacterized protein {ECO:0000313/EMBL:CCA75840.1} [Serendipita indica DSM 11827]|nr:SubName: Full=Uncharacterized protein {ECO:0000313/EMBL:CCA75840.1} [Serendipita indica DSM 11827]